MVQPVPWVDLESLPFCAAVALAARCARRVQPWYEQQSQRGPDERVLGLFESRFAADHSNMPKHAAAIETAAQVAELASHGPGRHNEVSLAGAEAAKTRSLAAAAAANLCAKDWMDIAGRNGNSFRRCAYCTAPRLRHSTLEEWKRCAGQGSNETIFKY